MSQAFWRRFSKLVVCFSTHRSLGCITWRLSIPYGSGLVPLPPVMNLIRTGFVSMISAVPLPIRTMSPMWSWCSGVSVLIALGIMFSSIVQCSMARSWSWSDLGVGDFRYFIAP